jgi:hypothetical protein
MGLSQYLIGERTKIPMNLKPIDGNISQVPVMGISEWMCYYANYDIDIPDDEIKVIDECIDVHLAAGMDQMVWNCGRSVVSYWSDLPNVTRMCEQNDLVGGKSWAFAATVMRKVCPLRRAIEYCRERDISVLGRLGMNRHYGSADYAGVTSRFVLDNPQFLELSKLGNRVSHRVCYAIEEVQQERIDILLEIQRIGVDGLVLDFCRQMPMMMYHDALVKPYMKKRGTDPKTIDSDDPNDYMDWFQYRSDVLTGFMNRLRAEVREQEEKLERPCPIIARIPDNAPWLMIAYGLDIERWYREDLVDGSMLSPFPVCVEDKERYPEYHISVAHKYGKICIGGIGSLNLIKNGVHENTGFFHRKPVYQMAHRQYRANADAMSLYQSETLARMGYLKETLKEIGIRELVAHRTEELPEPDIPADYPIGLDWHSRVKGGHSLSTEIAGDGAL